MIRCNLTPDQYGKLAEQLKDGSGIALVGAFGIVEKDGAKVKYTYDGKALQVEAVKAPFPFSKSWVEGKIAQALREHGVVVG